MASFEVQLFDALRLVLGLAFLAIAAVMDVRTRKVHNRLWFIMFFVGIMVLELGYITAKAPAALLLTPIPAMIFFIVIFTEGEIGEDALSEGANMALTVLLIVVAIAIMIFQGQVLKYSTDWVRSLHIPIIVVVSYGLYLVGMLRGGADAKAFMCLAVLAPFYPSIGPMPFIRSPEQMMIILPFALVVLFDSALATMLVPLGYAVYNLGRGETDRRMFFGYRMDLKMVPHKFVWLMEKMEDGEMVTELFPKRGTKKQLMRDIKALQKAGKKRVWVTPKIPFMVPMVAGYLLAFVAGNLIFGLIFWIAGL
jgi:preflagellin peptidase FlaK